VHVIAYKSNHRCVIVRSVDQISITVMDSDLPISQYKSHQTVTFKKSQNSEAPQTRLRRNPPTIGKILKFKKAISNTNTHTGILDYTRDGDQLSPGSVSYIFTIFLFPFKIPLLIEMFSGVAIVKTAEHWSFVMCNINSICTECIMFDDN
jgi:hypothetical protein